MALKIQKANQIRYPLRAYFYGDSGVGKTYLAIQADLIEGMSPVLVVSCDMGMSTARRSDVDVLIYESSDQMVQLVRQLKQRKLPYKTVVIDGFSQFYDSVVLGLSSGNVPQIQDWMKASHNVKKLIREFVRIDVNIIVTSLGQLLQEESSGIFYRVPLVPGKMAWRIAASFDLVGYIDVRGGGKSKAPERFMQVQPYRRTIAKDRDATLGTHELNITWLDNSGQSPPMQYIWTQWTSHQVEGAKLDDSREPDDITEDEALLYETGDSSLEGGA